MSKAETKICLPVLNSDEGGIPLGPLKVSRLEIILVIIGLVVVIACLGTWLDIVKMLIIRA